LIVEAHEVTDVATVRSGDVDVVPEEGVMQPFGAVTSVSPPRKG